MTGLDQLRIEHSYLADLARQLMAMIKEDIPPTQKDLYFLRQEFASALIRHLKTEDWVVYPQLLASSDKIVSETARLYSDEMGGLATEFRVHCERWGSLAIQADWNGYRVETAALLKTLSRRANREDRVLYRLLDTVEPLPRRLQA